VTRKQRGRDTPLTATIEQHIERAESLHLFFDKLAGENKPQVDSPTNTQAQLKRLLQIGQEFTPYLGDRQQSLLQEKQAQLQQAAIKQREAARTWVTEQEQAYQKNAPIAELDKRLANPPVILAFLSPAEQGSLVNLRQNVRQRLDADTLAAIESRFKQISDRRLQEECLERLQQILRNERE
jgi:hypothetical protein